MTAITALRAINDRLNASLRQVVEGLTDEQLLYRAPAIDERSLEEVAFHAMKVCLNLPPQSRASPGQQPRWHPAQRQG